MNSLPTAKPAIMEAKFISLRTNIANKGLDDVIRNLS